MGKKNVLGGKFLFNVFLMSKYKTGMDKKIQIRMKIKIIVKENKNK